MFSKHLARPRVSGMTAVVAALALALSACGETSEEEQVEHAVSALQDDLADGRVDEVCASMTRQVHKQVGQSADGAPTHCAKDLRRLLKVLEPGGGMRDRPTVDTVEVRGDDAVVRVVSSDGDRTGVLLRKHDGDWKLANFFGASTYPLPKPEAPAAFPTGPNEVAPVAGPGVRATGGETNGPCGDVRAVGRMGAEGGCTAAAGGDVDVSGRTVFGSFDIASCKARVAIHVNRDGGIWITGFDPTGGKACGGVYSCWDRDFAFIPWKGRIRAVGGNRFRGQVGACVVSCLGRFEGPVDVELVRTGRGWRMRFDDAPIGPGGMRIDASWKVAPGEFVGLRQVPA